MFQLVKRRLPMVLLVLWAIAAFSVPIAASAGGTSSTTPESQSDIGFYVQAVLPQNQYNTNVSYFDLLMEPEQRQSLEVQIINESDEEIVVEASAISASTNRNGIIDYKTPGVRDETLRIPFSDIATIVNPEIRVPARSSATVVVQLTMPQNEYDGVILGGILMTKQSGDLTTGEGGAVIQNIYSYVIGVTLRENEVEVLPDFELLSVEAEAVNYRPAMVHYLRNREAAIVKGLHITVDIYEGGDTLSDELIHYEQKNVDMAPNSVYPLAITTPDNTEIRPGTYTSIMEVEDRNGKLWRFEKQFVITGELANEVNDTAITQSQPFPWIWVLLGIILLLLILSILLILLLFKRRRKDENEEEEIQR